MLKSNFTSKAIKRWLKFLFYECPKYSLSRPVRKKFLYQLGATCRLLLTIIAVVLICLLANENVHLRKENILIQDIVFRQNFIK